MLFRSIIIVGAHYDSYYNPGADNNASGVACLLELARLLSQENPEKTIRFIGFGEKIDDLQPFNAREFVDALFGE